MRLRPGAEVFRCICAPKTGEADVNLLGLGCLETRVSLSDQNPNAANSFGITIYSSACHLSKRSVSGISNLNRNIMYVFPDSITNFFQGKLNDSVYFCLYSDSSCYDLYISWLPNVYSNVTNRRVFIKGKSYPLIFDYDMYLGTTTPEQTLKTQYKAGGDVLIAKSVTINEGFHVRFKKGTEKIVASGYGLLK